MTPLGDIDRSRICGTINIRYGIDTMYMKVLRNNHAFVQYVQETLLREQPPPTKFSKKRKEGESDMRSGWRKHRR